jgi:hypothetical protein
MPAALGEKSHYFLVNRAVAEIRRVPLPENRYFGSCRTLGRPSGDSRNSARPPAVIINA